MLPRLPILIRSLEGDIEDRTLLRLLLPYARANGPMSDLMNWLPIGLTACNCTWCFHIRVLCCFMFELLLILMMVTNEVRVAKRRPLPSIYPLVQRTEAINLPPAQFSMC